MIHHLIGRAIDKFISLPDELEVVLILLAAAVTALIILLFGVRVYIRVKNLDRRLKRWPKQIHGHRVKKSYLPWLPLIGKYRCQRCGESVQHKKIFMEGKRCEEEVSRYDG